MLMGGKEELQLNMWKTAVDSMMKHLRSVSTKGDVYLAESISGGKILKSDELVI
jgi:mannosyl-oligosaccharide alpha-1,2-mannosidase